MYPGHPNLLPAITIDDPHELTESFRKPKLGREGANISIVGAGMETATGGVYGEEGFVYQLLDPLPQFDDMRPALARGSSATRRPASASARPPDW